MTQLLHGNAQRATRDDACNAVANGIFDDWLQQKRWNACVERGGVNFDGYTQPVAEPKPLEFEISIEQ